MRPPMRCRATGLALAWGSGLALAQGQPFPIVPPKLPPRAAAAATAAAQPPAQPAIQPAYPPANQPAYAPAGQVQPPGSASAYRAPAPPSYGAPYGAPAAAALAPATVVQPAKAAAGACRAQPSPDRQTLSLVSGPEALPREHVPLGEYRAQQVVHSADGRWAVAFTKLRGQAQFAALTIDLERCLMQRTIELPGAGGDAEFQGDEAVLRFDGGERRVALRDGRVR